MHNSLLHVGSWDRLSVFGSSSQNVSLYLHWVVAWISLEIITLLVDIFCKILRETGGLGSSWRVSLVNLFLPIALSQFPLALTRGPFWKGWLVFAFLDDPWFFITPKLSFDLYFDLKDLATRSSFAQITYYVLL